MIVCYDMVRCHDLITWHDMVTCQVVMICHDMMQCRDWMTWHDMVTCHDMMTKGVSLNLNSCRNYCPDAVAVVPKFSIPGMLLSGGGLPGQKKTYSWGGQLVPSRLHRLDKARAAAPS